MAQRPVPHPRRRYRPRRRWLNRRRRQRRRHGLPIRTRLSCHHLAGHRLDRPSQRSTPAPAAQPGGSASGSANRALQPILLPPRWRRWPRQRRLSRSSPTRRQPGNRPAVTQQVAVIQFGSRLCKPRQQPDLAILQKVAEMQRTNRATVRIVGHHSRTRPARRPTRRRAPTTKSRAGARSPSPTNSCGSACRPAALSPRRPPTPCPPLKPAPPAASPPNRRADIFIDF